MGYGCWVSVQVISFHRDKENTEAKHAIRGYLNGGDPETTGDYWPTLVRLYHTIAFVDFEGSFFPPPF